MMNDDDILTRGREPITFLVDVDLGVDQLLMNNTTKIIVSKPCRLHLQWLFGKTFRKS